MPRDMVCPVGARCTITTRATWSDADDSVIHGAETISAAGSHFGFGGTQIGHRFDFTKPQSETHCDTGVRGSRCSTTARLQVLGERTLGDLATSGGRPPNLNGAGRPVYGA